MLYEKWRRAMNISIDERCLYWRNNKGRSYYRTAVIAINVVSVENVLVPFCCVLGKNIIRHFSLFVVLDSSFKFQSNLYKIKITNFNQTAIFWQLRKQVEVIACLMHSASVTFVVRKINIG